LPEYTLSWKAFLAVGHDLKARIRCHEELFLEGDLDKLLVEMKLKEPEDAVESRKAEETPEPVEEPVRESAGEMVRRMRKLGENRMAAFGRNERQKSPSPASVLNNEEAFPFLKGLEMPISAKAIAAILASIYAETYRQVSLDDIPRILRLLEIPIESHAVEGEKLVKYAKRDDSLLDLNQERVTFRYILWLNKKGYRALLGIEPCHILPEDYESDFPRRQGGLFRFGKSGRNPSEKERRIKHDIPKLRLDDLVLDKEAILKLKYVVKHHGLDKKAPFKLLFWGPPGTGKTYTALALAGELGKPLVTLDLSKVLEMYVGETEKSLSNCFDQAEKDKAIIFMDEADSFFKERRMDNRSWENNQVNHVLKLIETRKVSVILCTNLFEALDDALLRRLDEVIEYRLPNVAERAEIWEKELKKNGLDDDGLDLGVLSRIEISGGLIANAVRKANKMKVVEGEDLQVDTLFLQGLASDEMKKLGKSFAAKRICGFGG